MIEQAIQWPTSVALNTHTLKGLGGVDIINRLSKIQVVIKKTFLKVRDWTVSVPEVGWTYQAGKVFQILRALQ